ncbi:MAG TPA: hypothetical protein VGQ09_18135 [Chitinophagaceae bacterium]|nr:hypothetical protein [Chitinophagaceae bacterium]
MRDQDLEPKFSWPIAFFITGISFIAFFFIFEKLNDALPVIFLWIGIATLTLAIISGIGSLFIKRRPGSQRTKK